MKGAAFIIIVALSAAPAFALESAPQSPTCKSVDCLKLCTEKNDGNACATWAALFEEQRDDGVRELTAAPYHVKACALGAAPSCVWLGAAHLENAGLRVDVERAIAYLAGPCERGRFEACSVLITHEKVRDLSAGRAARDRLRKACGAENLDACDVLRAHNDEFALQKSDEIARRFCAEGDATACYYASGFGHGASEGGAKPDAKLRARAVELAARACAKDDRACWRAEQYAGGDAAMQQLGCKGGAKLLCLEVDRGKCRDLDLDACDRVIAAKASMDFPSACRRSTGKRSIPVCVAAGLRDLACERGSAAMCRELELEHCREKVSHAEACEALVKREPNVDHRPMLLEKCIQGSDGACRALAEAEAVRGNSVRAAYAKEAARCSTMCDADVTAKNLDDARYGCKLHDVAACKFVWQNRKSVPAKEVGAAGHQACAVGDDTALCLAVGRYFDDVNPLEAIEYYALACERKDARGCREGAARYFDGRGVDKSLSDALRFEEKACALGDYNACAAVARLR